MPSNRSTSRQLRSADRLVLPAPDLSPRLGLSVPAAWWPTPPMLKSFEAAGFAWVQVHTPPRPILCERRESARHAAALRRALDTTGLRLILHGPDDLSLGTPPHDRAFDGALDYAEATGAEFLVYHGANFPEEDGGEAACRVRDRLAAEESSLRARIPRIERLGLVVTVENLAPVWPGPPRVCHTPSVVCDLVDRIATPGIRMLFDVGHANITADLVGADPAALLEGVRSSVGLFHVHDNLGARRRREPSPALDPLRLDLHLAPGAGRAPWAALAPALVEHEAPLLLEIHPPYRPEPLAIATQTAAVLGGRRPPVGQTRPAFAPERAGVTAIPPG